MPATITAQTELHPAASWRPARDASLECDLKDLSVGAMPAATEDRLLHQAGDSLHK
jgi:hypothetical protein